MCDMNYEYFKSNFEELYEKYPEKHIVVKNESIIGVYESFDEAYEATIKTEELGTFLIQHCTKSQDSLNYFYSNNVVFA